MNWISVVKQHSCSQILWPLLYHDVRTTD